MKRYKGTGKAEWRTRRNSEKNHSDDGKERNRVGKDWTNPLIPEKILERAGDSLNARVEKEMRGKAK